MAVVLLLDHVSGNAGPGEGVPLAAFPVVDHVAPESDLSKRVGRLAMEGRVGPVHAEAHANARRQVEVAMAFEVEGCSKCRVLRHEEADTALDGDAALGRLAFGVVTGLSKSRQGSHESGNQHERERTSTHEVLRWTSYKSASISSSTAVN